MRTGSRRPLSTPFSRLFSAVLDLDTRKHVAAAGVAERHDEGMHAVALAAGLSLREDHGEPGVAGCTADVVLARSWCGVWISKLPSAGS